MESFDPDCVMETGNSGQAPGTTAQDGCWEKDRPRATLSRTRSGARNWTCPIMDRDRIRTPLTSRSERRHPAAARSRGRGFWLIRWAKRTAPPGASKNRNLPARHF